MRIGREEPAITVEPAQDPVRRPAVEPMPAPEPDREPVRTARVG